MIQKGGSSCSECNPVLSCHRWWERKSSYPDITGSFSQEGIERYNWNQQGIRTCAINVRCEWNCILPLSPVLMTLHFCHLLPPLPHLVTSSFCLLTQCQPVYASYCTGLLYFSRYCTVRFFFHFCVCFYVWFIWIIL